MQLSHLFIIHHALGLNLDYPCITFDKTPMRRITHYCLNVEICRQDHTSQVSSNTCMTMNYCRIYGTIVNLSEPRAISHC